MRQQRVFGWGLLGLVLLVAACGGDDDDGTAASGAAGGASIEAQRAVLASQGVFVDDPAQVRYLSAVDTAWDEFAGRDAAAMQERLESGPNDRDALFRSALEVGAGEAHAAVRAAAAEIEPPSEYEADFAAFNDYLAATVDADLRYAAAAEDEDLVALALANADLTFAGVRARGRLEPTTCRIIFGSSCPPALEAGADAYERALRLEVDELAGGLSRVGQLFVGPQHPFGIALTAAEDRELAEGLVERGLSLLAITGVALDAVDATPAFAADHNILQILVAEAAAVLEETGAAIETEGWRRDGRDRLLGGRLIASVCKAIDTLSDDARALSGLDGISGPDNSDLCESGLPNPPAEAPSG